MISRAVCESSCRWQSPSSLRLNAPSQMEYPHTKGCAFSSALQMASAAGLAVA